MAERKPFLLRLSTDVMEQLHLWAKDDLRSLNAQIEFLLREALRTRRKKTAATEEQPPPRE